MVRRVQEVDFRDVALLQHNVTDRGLHYLLTYVGLDLIERSLRGFL